MASILFQISPTATQLTEQMLHLNSASTAIVAIEFQKTWTRKGNFLHRLIAKPLVKNKVVDRTLNFLRKARQKGYTVIHAPLVLDKANKEEYRKMPFMPKIWNAFTQGTWKAEFEDGIYQADDIIAQGRYGFNACKGSNLQQLLHDGGFTNALVLGFLTDQCVEATIKALKQDGFNCVVVTDCTAAITQGIQMRVEKRNLSASSIELISKM